MKSSPIVPPFAWQLGTSAEVLTLHAALFALDGIALFASLLLAAGLVVSRPRSAAMWIAALILINSAGYVMFGRFMFGGRIPEPYQLQLAAPLALTLQVMMNTTPGLFMLLCFLLFQGAAARFRRGCWCCSPCRWRWKTWCRVCSASPHGRASSR